MVVGVGMPLAGVQLVNRDRHKDGSVELRR
jgi:hypothetical protein